MLFTQPAKVASIAKVSNNCLAISFIFKSVIETGPYAGQRKVSTITILESDTLYRELLLVTKSDKSIDLLGKTVLLLTSLSNGFDIISDIAFNSVPDFTITKSQDCPQYVMKEGSVVVSKYFHANTNCQPRDGQVFRFVGEI